MDNSISSRVQSSRSMANSRSVSLNRATDSSLGTSSFGASSLRMTGQEKTRTFSQSRFRTDSRVRNGSQATGYEDQESALAERNAAYFAEIIRRKQELKRMQEEELNKLSPEELQMKSEADEENKKHQERKMSHLNSMGAYSLSRKASLSFMPVVSSINGVEVPQNMRRDALRASRQEKSRSEMGRYSMLLNQLFPDATSSARPNMAPRASRK